MNSEENSQEKCGWCGRPITNDFYWTENTRGVKIHHECLSFLWKLGIATKESVILQAEIVRHFEDIRHFHVNESETEFLAKKASVEREDRKK